MYMYSLNDIFPSYAPLHVEIKMEKVQVPSKFDDCLLVILYILHQRSHVYKPHN
jgi:hypothetical protein